MANFTWNGGTSAYLDSAQWTPATVPLYGADTVAIINGGTATLSNAEPNGITLNLGGPLTATALGPTLTLDNAALGPDLTLDEVYFGVLDLEGYDSNFGTIAIGDPLLETGSTLQFQSASSGQLNQYGTMTIGLTGLADFAASTLLNNDGLIALNGGELTLFGLLSGNGTVELAAASSQANVRAAVGPDQTFALDQGALVLSDFGTFQAKVADFTSNAASLTLDNVSVDAATYAADATGEHLVLTDNGQAVGDIELSNTPDTQYTVIQNGSSATITPSDVLSDGSIPAVITQGRLVIQNAEPNGQTVALGGDAFAGPSGPNLVLDNAALGPSLLLEVGSPANSGVLSATLTVQGYDTNYGEIDVAPGNTLTIDIGTGSQFNQEGTIHALSPQNVGQDGSTLIVNEPGPLNNDGTIDIGPGSTATFETAVTGSGTITIDQANADLFTAAATQTIDFLGGDLLSATSLAATIKDWDSQGQIAFNAFISSVQFNQTSAVGGDLQLFAGGSTQVGDLQLLGTYTTSDFVITPGHTDVGLSIGRPATGLA